jgi:hypothetical protein
VIQLDAEIKVMFLKLLEGQARLDGKVSGFEKEVRKNSIKLKTIDKKINIIATIQTIL